MLYKHQNTFITYHNKSDTQLNIHKSCKKSLTLPPHTIISDKLDKYLYEIYFVLLKKYKITNLR